VCVVVVVVGGGVVHVNAILFNYFLLSYSVYGPTTLHAPRLPLIILIELCESFSAVALYGFLLVRKLE
jgi:hypothetical protein